MCEIVREIRRERCVWVNGEMKRVQWGGKGFIGEKGGLDLLELL